MDPIHAKLIRFFEKKNKGKILDAGAGDGKLSTALSELGFTVSACDIDRDLFQGKTSFKKADLNKGIPYPDNHFDYVLLTEVIEHLENPNHIIRECSRVIKSGGIFITTTPNVANIFSRLKFLITGELFCFSKTERHSKHGHINPIPYWEIEDIMEKNNFKLLNIESNNYLAIPGSGASGFLKKTISNMAYVFMYPLLNPKNKEILKGDNLIFFAQKVR